MTVEASPRLAIIGCGGEFQSALVLALRSIGWRPSVLIDNSAERLGTLARQLGRQAEIIKSANWNTVANEFDAACIALPSAPHEQMGAALLEAGKHLFIGAPLESSAGEWRRMLVAARQGSSTLSVGLYRRYFRAARWTKALLQSGLLGDIKHVDIHEGLPFNWDKTSDPLHRPNPANRKLLFDDGAHTLDLLLWLLGNVVSLNYRDDGEGGVESECILGCQFESGASAQIELSRTRQLRNSMRIEGKRGSVEIHLYKNEVLGGSVDAMAFQHEGVGPHQLRFQPVTDLLESALRDFRSGIVGGDGGVTGTNGTKTVELIESCYATRQPLLLPWEVSAVPTASDLPIPMLPRGSKVLVTGATGFVGGRLVERLTKEHGVHVRCTIRDVARAARLSRLDVELMPTELTNADEVDHAVSGIDYVFHCAYDVRSRRQNIEGLRNIVTACANHSVRRLIHVSTFAVFEPFPDGPLTEETQDGDRSNTYVDTKLDMEKMIFDAARDHAVAATIIQPSIVYGPFCLPWTNTPAEMLIFGDVILPDAGEGLCNGVYIDDLIDSLVLAAISPNAPGERFIISGPRPVTWATFFSEFSAALGANRPKFWPYQQMVAANQSTVRNIILAILNPKRLIKTIVGWKSIRRILQTALDTMPSSLRVRVTNYYFNPVRRQVGETFLPNPQALALYRSRAVAVTEKARFKLGYEPRYDFQRGMLQTGQYLKWAYGDIIESVSNGKRETISENNGPGNIVE